MRFDNNRYSVSAHAVGRLAEMRAYAERIVLRHVGRLVGEHRRWTGSPAVAGYPKAPIWALAPARLTVRAAASGRVSPAPHT